MKKIISKILLNKYLIFGCLMCAIPSIALFSQLKWAFENNNHSDLALRMKLAMIGGLVIGLFYALIISIRFLKNVNNASERLVHRIFYLHMPFFVLLFYPVLIGLKLIGHPYWAIQIYIDLFKLVILAEIGYFISILIKKNERLIESFVLQIWNKSILFYKRFSGSKVTQNVNFYRGIALLFVCLIVLFYFSKIHYVYKVPINKPYYTGEWDEPFAINSGISALRFHGNPRFFKYGGSCVYPHSLVFLINSLITGEKPVYYYYGHPYGRSEWPITRNIFPVRPIYQTKVAALLLFIFGDMFFNILFSLFLMPLSFWPQFLAVSSWFSSSSSLIYYSFQMLPPVHVALASGFTMLFFAKALCETDRDKHFNWSALCAGFASITIAVQISSVSIILLPLSLAIKHLKNGAFKYPKNRWKFLLALFAPYIVINPAVILSPFAYANNLYALARNSKEVAGNWLSRIGALTGFVQEIRIISSAPNLLLVALLISTIVILIKIDLYAFLAFSFFYLYSFQKLANMSEALYTRHFAFLIIPTYFWFVFPIIYLYQKVSQNIRLIAMILILLGTLTVYPYSDVKEGIESLFTGKFSQAWARESRDDLSDYVLLNKLKLYFYNFHNICIPENLRNKITLFTNKDELPKRLAGDERIAVFLYKTSDMDEYNQMMKYLKSRYKIDKVFGRSGGDGDIRDEGPYENPTILLFK